MLLVFGGDPSSQGVGSSCVSNFHSQTPPFLGPFCYKASSVSRFTIWRILLDIVVVAFFFAFVPRSGKAMEQQAELGGVWSQYSLILE